VTPVALELADVTKDYRGLRPLRLQRLVVAAGESVAILGMDGVMAEVFVNLVTGATVPDRGEVKAFGRPTTSVSDSAEWLALVDRFGIVSERAVLLDALDVIQNLAMPFTLEIEPVSGEIRDRASSLAREVGLAERSWPGAVGALDPVDRLRVRLARALALDPAALLLEHASAGVSSVSVVELGADIRRVAARRGAAVIALTADAGFAAAVASRVLHLDPGSGRLEEPRRRRWFGGRVG
jgi:ABC-type transporter Mla maintaining outer membrane lipid asymmetry ATPase subunit MlaF